MKHKITHIMLGNAADSKSVFTEEHLLPENPMHADPQPRKEKQSKHMITLVSIYSSTLSHQFPPPPHILSLLCSFPLPSNTTQNIDTSPPPSSLSLSLHHSLSLLNTDRLSTPWSEFQISSPLVAEPQQQKKNKNPAT